MSQRKIFIILSALSAVFFSIYLFLYWPGSGQPENLILNQPDEAINYFFIKRLAIDGQFGFPESLSHIAADQVHPRSTTVVNGNITPIGFPGMIFLFGYLLRFLTGLFGVGLFNFFAVCLTPFIAAITPMFFYGFLRRIFEKSTALASSLMLYVLPGWWYYASRPFQHNTLFVFCLVAGLYIGSRMLEASMAWKKNTLAFFTGVCFALLVYIRSSEAVLVSLLLVILLYFYRKKIGWHEVFYGFVGIFAVAILFFATQTLYYGHPFASGYVKSTIDGSGGIIFSGPQGINFFKAIFLPFGFDLKAILKNGWNYGGLLFGWWFVLGVLGLLCSVFKSIKKRAVDPYLIIFVIISAYLFIFYGSWQFSDNLARVPSIGTSYVRYFLLIYVFSLPLIAQMLRQIMTGSKMLKMALVLFSLGLFYSSYFMVFARFEGLEHVRTIVMQYADWQNKIYAQTEADSVIVTRYADKYLFPGRKVITDWSSSESKRAISALVVSGTPVYWHDLKQEKIPEFEKVQLSDTILSMDNLELRKFEKSHEL